MNKYIKKPIEIEAIQWNGNNLKEIMEFLDSEFPYEDNTEYATRKFSYYKTTNNLYINTLEGNMKANIGDYIIKGVNGEFYPCKPDIFEKTYDKVYTLEQVKKEWEELGYEWCASNNNKHIILIKEIKKDIYNGDFYKIININSITKNYACYINESYSYDDITFQEHNLLTKTFKALGWK